MCRVTVETTRRRVGTETVLVLAVSLGQSAVYSLVSLLGALTAKKALADQSAALNSSAAPGRPWLDLTYQVLGIAFALAPVALALHLMSRDDRPVGTVLGIDRRHPVFDLGSGALLALCIGAPGLGLYFGARALGLAVNVVPSALPHVWWQIPILVLSAVQNAVLEEVIVVGYLITRLRQLDWRLPAIIATSALLRGSYHLYQGFGGFVGNAIMGVIFALFWVRTRRLAPLIVAHSLLDITAFVGYAVLHPYVSWL